MPADEGLVDADGVSGEDVLDGFRGVVAGTGAVEEIGAEVWGEVLKREDGSGPKIESVGGDGVGFLAVSGLAGVPSGTGEEPPGGPAATPRRAP